MEQRCECTYHRYHIVHTVVGSTEIYDHSQGTWNTHLRGLEPGHLKTFSSALYRHGMTATQLEQAAKGGVK